MILQRFPNFNLSKIFVSTKYKKLQNLESYKGWNPVKDYGEDHHTTMMNWEEYASGALATTFTVGAALYGLL